MTEERAVEIAKDIYKNFFGDIVAYPEVLKAIAVGVLKGGADLEKQSKQLQEENEQLKKEKIPQLERKIASIRGAHSVDCKKLNARIKQVERLKKENEQLKTELNEAKENGLH